MISSALVASPLATFGIRAWMFFIPLPAAIRTFGSQLLFFYFLYLEETEKRREEKKEEKRGLHLTVLDTFRLE